MSKIRFYGPVTAIVAGWLVMILAGTLNLTFVIGNIISVVGLSLFIRAELIDVLSDKELDHSDINLLALVFAGIYIFAFILFPQDKWSSIAVWLGVPIIIDILGWINISAISTYRSALGENRAGLTLEDITEANDSWGRELLQKVSEINKETINDTQAQVLQAIRDLVEEGYQIRKKKKKNKSVNVE